MSRGTSLVLDRQYKSVGRIKRSTGTNDKQMLKLLDAMLDTLYRAGRLDILQGIRDGHLHLLTVWSQYRIGELHNLPSAKTLRPLKETMEVWVATGETGMWNRAARRYGVRALLRHARPAATIEDLPDVVQAYGAKTTRAPMFNRTRAAALAFVRDTLGKTHPIYNRIRDIRVKTERPRHGNPQTPDQIRVLASKLAPEFASIMWAMALTGMGPGELWGTWTQHDDHIHIHGTKRKGRVRDIPKAMPIASPTRPYRAFYEALVAASDKQVKPYDLRRTFAVWMVLGEISRVRRKLYLGHGAGDVSELYERHEMEHFLVEDAEKLRLVVEERPKSHPSEVRPLGIEPRT